MSSRPTGGPSPEEKRRERPPGQQSGRSGRKGSDEAAAGGGGAVGGGVEEAEEEHGLNSDDELEYHETASGGSSENLDFLYEGLGKERGDEEEEEEGGRDSASSVSLSLPPSFDDSLDISPFLARFEGLESTPVVRKILPSRARVGEAVGGQLMQARLLELESQVEHLTHGRRMLEAHLRHEREQWSAQLSSAEEKRRAEVEALRQQQSAMEAQLRSYRLKLEDQRSIFRDLEISEQRFLEISRTHEDDLSLKDFVAMRTHAQVKAVKEELEKTRRNLQDTQDTLTSVSEQLELHVRESQRNKRSAEARETSLRRELEEGERRIKEQQMLLEEALARLKATAEREQSFDRVHTRMLTAEKEVAELKALVESQAAALASTTESEKTLQRRVADLSHHNEVLLMDKTFLAKEAEMAARRAETAEKEADRQTDKVRDLKRRKEELQAALIEAKDQATIAYEERLNTELTRLREESAKELADLKTTSREMLERENKALREAREDALAEADRARTQLAELNKAHEDLIFRLSRCESGYESTVSELRGELKIKAFELSRIGVTLEEKTAALRQTELQVSMLRAKLDLHEKEFARLEATSSARVNELTALLQGEKDKVKGYEDLESQLDDAIVRTGMDEGAGTILEGFISPGAGARGGAALASTLESLLPTAPQRRMKHAVHLAQKLGERERELKSARHQLKEVRGRADRAEQQAEEMAKLLENASQPGRYVVDLVREKDRELDRMRERLADMEHQMHELEGEKAELQMELSRQMNQREEIRSLRLLLQELQSHEEGLPTDVDRDLHASSPPVAEGGGETWLPEGLVMTPDNRAQQGEGGVSSASPDFGQGNRTAHPELELVLQGSVGRTPKWHRSFRAD